MSSESSLHNVRFIDAVVGDLFRIEIDQLVKKFSNLADENDRIRGGFSQGFLYRGLNYGRYGLGPSIDVVPLSPELIEKAQQLVNTRTQVLTDRVFITQILHKLARPCTDRQELRNALPECLINLCAPEWKDLPRTAEPASRIRDNPREFKQYQKALAKIEMYAALRFLY